jgi:hypothetical protein
MITETKNVNTTVPLPTMTSCSGFSCSLVFENQQHLDHSPVAAHPVKQIYP